MAGGPATSVLPQRVMIQFEANRSWPLSWLSICTPEQIRTAVSALRGRRPRPLDECAMYGWFPAGAREQAGGGGFEPPLPGPEPGVLPLDDPPLPSGRRRSYQTIPGPQPSAASAGSSPAPPCPGCPALRETPSEARLADAGSQAAAAAQSP